MCECGCVNYVSVYSWALPLSGKERLTEARTCFARIVEQLAV